MTAPRHRLLSRSADGSEVQIAEVLLAPGPESNRSTTLAGAPSTSFSTAAGMRTPGSRCSVFSSRNPEHRASRRAADPAPLRGVLPSARLPRGAPPRGRRPEREGAHEDRLVRRRANQRRDPAPLSPYAAPKAPAAPRRLRARLFEPIRRSRTTRARPPRRSPEPSSRREKATLRPVSPGPARASPRRSPPGAPAPPGSPASAPGGDRPHSRRSASPSASTTARPATISTARSSRRRTKRRRRPAGPSDKALALFTRACEAKSRLGLLDGRDLRRLRSAASPPPIPPRSPASSSGRCDDGHGCSCNRLGEYPHGEACQGPEARPRPLREGLPAEDERVRQRPHPEAPPPAPFPLHSSRCQACNRVLFSTIHDCTPGTVRSGCSFSGPKGVGFARPLAAGK